MYTLEQWCARWGMPQSCIGPALAELATMSIHQGESSEMSESGVQSRVRLEASKKGIHLWRNNVGAGKVVLEDGGASRFMRWGLANDSKQINVVLKSGDLIGFREITIGPAQVGQTIAQFVSREIKPAGWKYGGSLRECAQLQWAALINAKGGDAKIVTGLGSFD